MGAGDGEHGQAHRGLQRKAALGDENVVSEDPCCEGVFLAPPNLGAVFLNPGVDCSTEASLARELRQGCLVPDRAAQENLVLSSLVTAS